MIDVNDYKFSLEIEFGNDAVLTSYDLAELLSKVASRIKKNKYPLDKEEVRGIMDYNGNSVGSWEIERK
jgi:hypothetical protein